LMKNLKNYIRGTLTAVILLLVFVMGCSDLSGGGGCSGTQAQGWSGFAAYQKDICFGSMEGRVIALNPQARSDNKTFPADTEWVYIIKTSAPGAACGALCTPSASAAGQGIYGTPAVVGDLIYVGTYTGKIYALNASRGVVRWIYPREALDSVGAIVGSIVTDNQSLFFASSNGKVYCLDAATGDYKWEYQTSNKIWITPTLDNGILYLGNYGGEVFALAADTGRPVWNVQVPSAVASSIAVDGDVLYFGTFDSYLHAVDKATGQEKWKYQGGNWFWAKPVVKDGKIYAACLDSKLYALDTSGNELWKYVADSPLVSTPAIAGTAIYLVGDKGMLYKVDIQSGAEITRTPVGYTVFSNPYVDGDMVYVYARDHNVYAVDMARGVVVWKFSSYLK